MPWIVNLAGARIDPKGRLTQSEMQKWSDFINYIGLSGEHPRDAARFINSEYRKLGGTTDQYEIRLSKGNRATFRVIANPLGGEIRNIVVGGHT